MKEKRKLVVLTTDASLVIRKLFSLSTVSLFRSSLRYHFYFLLSINLLLDCSIRIGDLVKSSTKQKKHQVLLWKDVEFFAFPPENAETFPDI